MTKKYLSLWSQVLRDVLSHSLLDAVKALPMSNSVQGYVLYHHVPAACGPSSKPRDLASERKPVSHLVVPDILSVNYNNLIQILYLLTFNDLCR